MTPEQFVTKLYDTALQAGIKEFSVVYGCGSSNRIDVYDGKVSNRRNNEGQGVSLSVKCGKNIGSFACEELNEELIPLMVKEAKENAELINAEEENFFHDGSGEYKKALKYKPLPEFSKLDKEKYLLEVEKSCYQIDKRVKKVISLYIADGKSSSIMKNSLGLDLKDDSEYAYAVLYLSAEENGVTKTGSEIILFDKKEDFTPLNLAKAAVEKAVGRLQAANIKSGKCKIVFENKTFADFLETIAGIFSANSVQEKRSQLVGKIGEVIASPIVTMIDNPLLENGYNTRSYDSEGYPSDKHEVIKGGVLKMFLHNLRTAKKDGVASTGNGSGGRGISFSNFYLDKGNFSKDDVLAKAGDGVYLTDLNGLHAGYSSVSGNFSFGAEGFIIENSKLGKALNQITVSGNVYRLLKDIEALGNDLEFTHNGFGAPTVLIKELAISNE